MQDRFGNFIGGYISGKATGGSITTLVDATKNIDTNLLANKLISIFMNGLQYVRKIASNTSDTITFATLPGAKGAGVWTVDTGVVITVTTAENTDVAYTLEAALAEEVSQDLSVALNGTVINVTLATDGDGLSDATKNTATLVTAALDALDDFTATLEGEGSTVCGETETAVTFSGGIDSVIPTVGVDYEIQL